MKWFLLLLICSSTAHFYAQDKIEIWKPNKKGSFYIYWGWNRSAYTKSDIHFQGKSYDFTLNNVIANDRQSLFRANLYFNPKTITIPQYNLRLGYYFKDKYEISFGADHMKYVMKNFQTVTMNGTIANSGTPYDGVYTNQQQYLDTSFLLFEHTDGLNYLNLEVRRSEALINVKHFNLSASYGAGLGLLVPRTNTTLLGNARHDKFNVAGYGLGLVGAVKINLFKYFFIQGEAKYGFIHMPDVRTTNQIDDKASQHFFFMQYNVVFGAQLQLTNRVKKTK
ncbi:hypothetical protein [Fluviicola taffensis]|uniref:Uncharacterized protein n=1 Tax=Fluviicola taffensis (strain DSM 16823 / NCIMB 13979 / RW262) TaxID=755732 RepID=F2IH88_FLUTR|nr:hypothetical protein [Fluviicola taffensis]AEA42643.1 hypothetical protein Fluta_0639 [Fluviicola taffensis DSM 16823]